MKKKKDKVTLKGVDKPEVFQHWAKDGITLHDPPYQHPPKIAVYNQDGKEIPFEYDPVNNTITWDNKDTPIFKVGIDPYHIEPIDNPQKPSQTIVSDTINDLNRIYENMFSKDLLEQMKYYTPATIVKERTPEDVMMDLKAIKMFYPEVLKQFLEDGK